MLINKWLKRELDGQFSPLRVVATLVAKCNLTCLHCFWSHTLKDTPVKSWKDQVQKVRGWQVPLIYSGRILNSKGLGFLAECFEAGIEQISVVDNGYTIFKAPTTLLRQLSHINISIDGWRENHDKQRNKTGSFDLAWKTVLDLKEMGLDPIVSACLSPLNLEGWEKFEELLAEYDVPLSCALISSSPAVATRGTPTWTTAEACQKAFAALLGGISKIINLYDLEHVSSLLPILKKMSWKPDEEEEDSLIACSDSGVEVVYRPISLLYCSEIVLRWDGNFYLPSLDSSASPFDFEHISPEHRNFVRSLNHQERELWFQIL